MEYCIYMCIHTGSGAMLPFFGGVLLLFELFEVYTEESCICVRYTCVMGIIPKETHV